MARLVSRRGNCAAALLFTGSSDRLCYCAGVVVDGSVVDGWVVDGWVDGVVVDGSVVDGVVDGVVVDGAVAVGSVVVAGGVAVSVAVLYVPGIRNITAKMMITTATTRPITVFRFMPALLLRVAFT